MADDAFAQDEILDQSGQEEEKRKGDDSGDEGGGAPAWMVTFGDMMSLLLCFFVLMISFSTMDVVKYRSLVGSLQDAFGAKQSAEKSLVAGRSSSMAVGEAQPGRHSMTEDELENELVSTVNEEGMTGEATVHRTDRGLVLRVRGGALFEPGSVRLRTETLPLLRKVAQVCRHTPRMVYVEGHTDNIPFRTERYPSNWELSSARASTVVRYMTDMELLPPEKFMASGLAANVPIATNLTQRGREKNRRVEFVFSGHPGDEP